MKGLVRKWALGSSNKRRAASREGDSPRAARITTPLSTNMRGMRRYLAGRASLASRWTSSVESGLSPEAAI
jgi:hypothetical protein